MKMSPFFVQLGRIVVGGIGVSLILASTLYLMLDVEIISSAMGMISYIPINFYFYIYIFASYEIF